MICFNCHTPIELDYTQETRDGQRCPTCDFQGRDRYMLLATLGMRPMGEGSLAEAAA